MKLNFIAAVIVASIFFCGCELFAERVFRIRFVNNSTDTVSVFHSLHYPDTSLRDEYINRPIDIIYPGEQMYIDSRIDWAKVIEQDIPGKKLQIFVLPGAVNSSINPERWPEIRQKYDVLHRFELTAKDLEDINYRIVYPEEK